MTLRNQAFAGLEPQQPDGLLALIAQCRADPRPDKVDVGVGVYRGEAGGTPVMRGVQAAEAALVAGQASKSYLGAEGDERFARLVWQLVSGEEQYGERRFGLQTPGGTGALRVGAELLACARPRARLWLGAPTRAPPTATVSPSLVTRAPARASGSASQPGPAMNRSSAAPVWRCELILTSTPPPGASLSRR